MSHFAEIFLFLLIVFAAGGTAIQGMRNRKKKKEREQIINAIDRENNLNNLILNRHEEELQQESKAYEISYTDKNKSRKNTAWVEIEERNRLSSRKYMLELMQPVRIGTAASGISIIVKDCGDRKYLCELVVVNKKLKLFNYSFMMIEVIRKKESIRLGGFGRNGLSLKCGDMIRIENTDYIINHIEIKR